MEPSRPSDHALLEERLRQQIAREQPRLRADTSDRELPEDVIERLQPLLDETVDAGLDAEIESLHEHHAVGGALVTGSAPVKLVRRVLARLLRPVLAVQSAVNASTARTTSALRDRSAHLRDHVVEHAQRLAVAELALAELRLTTRRLEQTVRFLEREQSAREGGAAPLFLDYAELTDRFRGSEESIRKRQTRHLRHFSGADEGVLDIGCGRGEFLELLAEAGVPAKGVEIDPELVELCREKGLDVAHADAVEYLERVPEHTLGGVFAAHVIEHMRPEEMVGLVRAAARALEPGGALVLETPNPECLVSLAGFSIDFTHVRLYHPEAMRWLLEQEGFDDVELDYGAAVELPPGVEPRDELAADPLRSLLFGYQEYAVAGRRVASA